RSFGIQTKERTFTEAAKSGILATILLGVIYVGIAFLGATSTTLLVVFDNRCHVLSSAAGYYFCKFRTVILSAVIILDCLTTAIGLVTANAEYFHTLVPNISYKAFVIFFSFLTFFVANFGLTNIIKFSEPVL